PAGSRRVSFQYTALNLSAPEKTRFQFKLEGHEKDWEENGGNRTAVFQELPPGRYVFRVRARNNDGIWNEAGAALGFVIEPFFWQTSWFRFVAGLILAASGGGSVWWALT